MTQCFNCHYNLGGLHCAIHGQINFHNEHCNDYEETRIRLWPKPTHIGYDAKYDGEGMTEKRSCAYCKHLQIDIMFGIRCNIHDKEWVNREYCSDYEKGDLE